jgi:hypothetical protein
MKDWKSSLDRYLTSGPPDNGFDEWCEVTINSKPDEFYEKNNEWINQNSYNCEINQLLEKFFKENLLPEEAAIEIIKLKS